MATEKYSIEAVLSVVDNTWAKGLNDAIAKLRSVEQATAAFKKNTTNNMNQTSQNAKQALDKIGDTKGFNQAGKSAEAMAKVVQHIPTPVRQSAEAINSTADKMAGKFKSNAEKIQQYSDKTLQTQKRNHQGFKGSVRGVIGSLSSLENKSEKTHKVFSSIFSGTIVANSVMNAFGTVKNALGGMVDEAKNYAEEQQTMNATWKTLTNSASKGQAMVNKINNMATSAQNSTHMVDGLAQKFYAVNNNAKQTFQLTKAILTLQDAFGKSDADVENFATQFSQMMANGKVSGQDMMSIVNTFPKLRPMLLDYERQIHHSRHMTMQELNKMISDGKVKSQDMINVVQEAGQKYKNATNNFTQTIPGMIRVIKSQIGTLLGAITTPLAKLAKPFYASIAKWVSRKKTHQEFEKLGKTVSSGMQKVIKAFSGGKKINVNKVLDNAIKGITNGLKNFFNWVKNHAHDIKTIVSSLTSITGQIGKSVWKSFSAIITTIGKMFGVTATHSKGSSDAIHSIAEILNQLAGNKLAIVAISKAIVAIAVLKGIGSIGGKVISIGAKGYKAYKNIAALRDGLKGIKDIKDFKGTEQAFFSLGKSVKGVFGAIKNLLSSTKAMTAGKIFGAAGTALVAGQQGIEAIKDRHSADKRSKDIGGAVGAVAGGALTSLIPVIGPWLAPIGALIGKSAGRWGGQAVNEFTKGWQRNKPPKKFWSLENLGYSAHTMWNGFKKGITNTLKWVKNNWKEIALYFVNPVAGALNSLYKHNRKFREWVNDIIKNVKNGLSTMGKNVKDGWNAIKKTTGSILKGIKGTIVGIWKSITKWLESTLKTIAKFFKSIWNGIKKTVSSIVKGIKTVISNTWSSITKTTKSIFDAIAKFINTVWGNIQKAIKTVIGAIEKIIGGGWKAIKGATKTAFNLIYNYIYKPVKSAYEKVKKFIGWIIDEFKSLGKINLFSIGKAIMTSLFNGLISIWNKGKSFIQGIAPWIKQHKGPIDYDAQLLVPAGKAIMIGFGRGMQTEYARLQIWIKGINQMISHEFSAEAQHIRQNSMRYARMEFNSLIKRGVKPAQAMKYAMRVAENIQKEQMNSLIKRTDIRRNNMLRDGLKRLNERTQETLNSQVSAQIQNNGQPATINLSLGGHNYRTFVSDITSQQDQDYDLEQRRY